MSGNQKGALRLVKTGLALSDANGIDAFRFNLLAHGSWAALTHGDRLLARKYIDAIGELAPTGVGRAVHYWLLAWFDWSGGETLSALEKMQASLAEMIKSDYAYGLAMIHCQLAKLLYEAGQDREAQANLDRALSIGRSGDSNWIKFNCYFVDASYRFEQNQEANCLDALRQGLRMGREIEIYTTFMWKPLLMGQLCAKALEHDIEVAYVQKMIRRNRLVPDTAGATLKNWPWPIKIYVLGKFRLVIDGRKVGSDSYGQKKVIELLKALVIFGGRNISATHLTDALWPDSEGDDASHALKTAVHRLRKLLGHAEAVGISAGHLSLNFQYCSTDLGNFERLINEGRNEAESNTSLEQAIKLYAGPLLNLEEAESWMIAPGERVRSKFLTVVTVVGQHWETRHQWAKAIKVYERALEVDQLIELFYLQLMRCHQNLGHHVEAISIYKRCSKILAAELGVEPSNELQQLGRILMNS